MAAENYKILGSGDLKDRLTVPGKWMQILKKLFVNGGNEALLRAEDWVGFCHVFRCSIRNKGPHDKPVFQAHDWKKFVKYAGLEVGDKIILEEIEETKFRGSTYTIIAQRKDINGLWANVQIPQRPAPEFHIFFSM